MIKLVEENFHIEFTSIILIEWRGKNGNGIQS